MYAFWKRNGKIAVTFQFKTCMGRSKYVKLKYVKLGSTRFYTNQRYRNNTIFMKLYINIL